MSRVELVKRNMNVPTRVDYMNKNCTHEKYYSAVLKTAGLLYPYPDEAFVARVANALKAGDEHLNTIPLDTWDRIAAIRTNQLHSALIKHGDFFSMAGGVCLMKQWLKNSTANT